MAKILVVEDDPAIGESLARILKREGHRVALAPDGIVAERVALSGEADLMLLDLGLPRRSGLEVLRNVRSAGAELPVLVVTANADEVDLVVGLDAGADDYVTKPFRAAELLARVRALLRRSRPADVVRGGGLEVDLATRTARLGSEELKLTPKEFELLAVLADHAGTVIAKQELVKKVWQTEWQGGSKTLNMHLSSLRRKLGRAAESAGEPAPVVRSVRGVGFVLEEV